MKKTKIPTVISLTSLFLFVILFVSAELWQYSVSYILLIYLLFLSASSILNYIDNSKIEKLKLDDDDVKMISFAKTSDYGLATLIIYGFLFNEKIKESNLEKCENIGFIAYNADDEEYHQNICQLVDDLNKKNSEEK